MTAVGFACYDRICYDCEGILDQIVMKLGRYLENTLLLLSTKNKIVTLNIEGIVRSQYL